MINYMMQNGVFESEKEAAIILGMAFPYLMNFEIHSDDWENALIALTKSGIKGKNGIINYLKHCSQDDIHAILDEYKSQGGK